MEKARKLDMTPDKYVFLYFSRTSSNFTTEPWGNITGRSNQKELKDDFLAFLQITIRAQSGPEVDYFKETVPKLSAGPPFYQSLFLNNSWKSNVNSLFGYDVAYTLCNVLNDTITLGESYRDVEWMMNISRNRVFHSRFGNIATDSEGDRIPDYTLWYYASGTDEYKPVMEIILTNSSGRIAQVVVKEKIIWPTPNNLPPLDTPKCGFLNEFCPSESTSTILFLNFLKYENLIFPFIQSN